MNNKNWNDRADKDLFFTILSVKNIGIISGSEWTTIGNHMRSLGYGFTNEGCRQHFQGLRRAQNKTEPTGPNGDAVRRNDPTMNPITRRPGPGRGRPRKQPPAPVPGAPGEGAPHPLPAPGAAPGPPSSAPPYQQGVQPFDAAHANHQSAPPQPVQTAIRPGSISSAPAAPETQTPGDAPPSTGSITYPSPPLASEPLQETPHLHPLQHEQPGQSSQQPQPEQQSQLGQQPQPTQVQLEQQSQSNQQLQPAAQSQPSQEIQPDYQPQELPQEPSRDVREATDASATSQPQPEPRPVEHQEPDSLMSQEQMGRVNDDIDADGDADGEADMDNDEPSAKRQRLGSPDPPKGDDMDDEAVLALAAHNGSADFASDFATYGEA
ncbi:uncharacterized protein FIESC28_08304 [Fusarium coffeatum]|uniref:Myb-like domain-containing protein n=1 Tax=Fusarium coffeatum TaxID=231269 RepID=A0A366R991_9HYPO|nr:uncharacterized protein FIESC28_08304 [Fusarium coffeatum]RBR13118.1 hypothetical protein FIESC28_08304 [Fusarium coffeatum]